MEGWRNFGETLGSVLDSARSDKASAAQFQGSVTTTTRSGASVTVATRLSASLISQRSSGEEARYPLLRQSSIHSLITA